MNPMHFIYGLIVLAFTMAIITFIYGVIDHISNQRNKYKIYKFLYEHFDEVKNKVPLSNFNYEQHVFSVLRNFLKRNGFIAQNSNYSPNTVYSIIKEMDKEMVLIKNTPKESIINNNINDLYSHQFKNIKKMERLQFFVDNINEDFRHLAIEYYKKEYGDIKIFEKDNNIDYKDETIDIMNEYK